MTTAHLRRKPPKRSQYRSPRRSAPTGCFVIHTTESKADERGPDSGAENVAKFIERRDTPGSYHALADSDSVVRLVDWGDEAYGDGTGSNRWAIHLSLACSAHQWLTLSARWRNGAISNLADLASEGAEWIEAETGIVVPARRISRAESERGTAGFISHGERDPARRSDPGANFPWEQFLSEFAARRSTAPTTPTPPTPSEEETEMKLIAALIKHRDRIFCGYADVRGSAKAPYDARLSDPSGWTYWSELLTDAETPERMEEISNNALSLLAAEAGL